LPQPGELPEYELPPVSEVAVAVRFQTLPGLLAPQLGLLWASKYRSRFPNVQQQAPIDPPIEIFDRPISPFSLTFETGAITPRLWFLNENESELIQVQPNWFAHNWRRPPNDESSYPRFNKVRSAFEEEFSEFQSFLDQGGLGEVHAEQCEVTYINQITRSGLWGGHGQIDRVIRLVTRDGNFLPEPEEMSVDSRFVIARENRPVGRLYVSCRPLYRLEDGEPILQLSLTARGRPESDNMEGILEFIELGHEWIVEGFTAVTTEAAHDLWRRTR
jgi:hypothetical protein